MLYWTFLENVLYAVRDQKVGKTVVLQDLQETVQAYENLSNTWTKP